MMRSMEGLGARGRGREMLCVVLQTPVEGAMFSGWVAYQLISSASIPTVIIAEGSPKAVLHPPDDTVTPNR